MEELVSMQKVIDLWDKYHHTIAVNAIEYDAELRKLPTLNQDSIETQSSDLISRAKAIDALNSECRCGAVIDHCGLETAMDIISELPPEQPEHIRGRWIYHPEWANDGECGYECSVCHMGSDIDYNFCMRCGADMRGEQDD